MRSQDVRERRSGGPAGLIRGLGWSLWACIIGTLFLRTASFATGALLGFVLGHFERHGLMGNGIGGGFEVGLLGAAFFVIEVAGAPAFGILVDRRGFRTFLILGPLAGIVSVLLEGATAASALSIINQQPTSSIVVALGGVALLMPMLFLARAFHGLSAAASIPATLAFLSAQTGDDAVRRSRAMAFFEVATIVGIGAGVALAGRLWAAFEVWSFIVAAGLYVISVIAFASSGRDATSRTAEHSARTPSGAFPVGGAVVVSAPGTSPPEPATSGGSSATHMSLREFGRFVTRPQVLRFVPAWIAVNAIVGLWVFYTPLLLTGTDDPHQLLVGGFDGKMVSNIYIGVAIAFLVGIVGWGYQLVRWAPTSVMQIGLGGLYALVAALFTLNHATAAPSTIVIVLVALVGVTLGAAAAFTPAALTYLAVLAEERAERRGATMGLYSVFLGVGQGLGILLAGPFHYWRGADGLIALTFLLATVSAVGIQFLRAWERSEGPSRMVAKNKGVI